MANVFINEEIMRGWADTIREKTGTTNKMKPDMLLSATQGLSTGDGEIVSVFKIAADANKTLSFQGWFKYEDAPKGTWIAYSDTANVTSMKGMFKDCTALITVPSFNTTNVTSMNSMFYSCKSLTTVPLFDTTNVTDMRYMFYSCHKLTTVPSFNTTNVTSMNIMFNGCTALTTVPLFNTTNVTAMGSMFDRCTALTTVPLFDTANVTNMNGMFKDCTALITVPSFNTTNVTDMNNMFNGCTALTECWLRNIKTNLQVGSGTTYGHLLTLESLLHLIKECRNDVNTSHTLTVGAANLEKLANVYVKLITITDDMRAEDDLIDEKLPFEVCESTDEGAMTIFDYAASKKWSIK